MTEKAHPKRLRPRFLPVVIAAGSGLLVLKIIGLATQGGYLLAAPAGKSEFGRALTGPRASFPVDGIATARRMVPPEDITGSVPPKKDDAKKDDGKKDDAKKADAKKADGQPPEKTAQTGKDDTKPDASQPMPVSPPNPAEKALLEKLSQRRQQLEERARELDMRESLIRSAEKLVDERLEELRSLEGRQDAGGKGRQEPAAGLKSLVVMYEAMKPRDAARVFEKMDQRVLTPLARQMNPRKLSEVLSLMSPEAAEKLTAALMRNADEPPATAPPAARPAAQPALEELPRVSPDGKTPKG